MSTKNLSGGNFSKRTSAFWPLEKIRALQFNPENWNILLVSMSKNKLQFS
jgi:hypothetical protein